MFTCRSDFVKKVQAQKVSDLTFRQTEKAKQRLIITYDRIFLLSDKIDLFSIVLCDTFFKIFMTWGISVKKRTGRYETSTFPETLSDRKNSKSEDCAMQTSKHSKLTLLFLFLFFRSDSNLQLKCSPVFILGSKQLPLTLQIDLFSISRIQELGALVGTIPY